jgi:hypothetical protein
MKAMLLQFILSILIGISFPSSLLGQNPSFLNTTIVDSSSLRIFGSSNITNFECIYTGAFTPTTFEHTIQLRNNAFAITGDTLRLVTEDFDCGRRGINKDFRNTLKNSEFPTIDITPIWFSNSDSTLNKINISISLAGVTKNYTINFESDSPSKNIFRIKGQQKLEMTDFDIDPPRALFGLIKVENELFISFDVFLRHL